MYYAVIPGINEDGCNPKLALTSKANVINPNYGHINSVNCSFRPYYSNLPVKSELSNMSNNRRIKHYGVARSSTPGKIFTECDKLQIGCEAGICKYSYTIISTKICRYYILN